MTLLIDDERNLAADRIARRFDDGIEALKEGGWTHLLLDHDLASFYWEDGELREKTGYDITKFLEEFPEFRPKKVTLVTASPVGRQNMARALQRMGYFRWSPTEFELPES